MYFIFSYNSSLLEVLFGPYNLSLVTATKTFLRSYPCIITFNHVIVHYTVFLYEHL
jgi:hypothetical protein